MSSKEQEEQEKLLAISHTKVLVRGHLERGGGWFRLLAQDVTPNAGMKGRTQIRVESALVCYSGMFSMTCSRIEFSDSSSTFTQFLSVGVGAFQLHQQVAVVFSDGKNYRLIPPQHPLVLTKLAHISGQLDARLAANNNTVPLADRIERGLVARRLQSLVVEAVDDWARMIGRL